MDQKLKNYEGTNRTEVFKQAVNKLDPNMIVNLATLIIERKHNLEELRIKGAFFLEALKIHEETVRVSLKSHHEQSMAVISACKAIIQTTTDESLKKEALISLVKFGSLSIEKLCKESESAFENIPKIK